MFFLHLLCSSIIIVIVITLITAIPIIAIWVNWRLSYPESKGKHWEAQWWAKMQGGKKQHRFHFCSPCKVCPKEPKADSWGTGECWTAGALLMAQPATTSRLRSGIAPVVMLDFLLILLLIFFFFLPSPSRTCRGVLWAGVTSRAPISCRTWPTGRVKSSECPTEAVPAVSMHDPAPVMLSKPKSPTLFYLLERTLPSSLLSSLTPDALLQSCPSLNQLVSGSVNVTAHLLQQQSPDVGGRLAGEKRKKNPSSQKKNPSSQPCCCSNQHLPVCYSQTWHCVHHPLGHYLILAGWWALGTSLHSSQQGWSLLSPAVSRAHWQHRVMAPWTVAVSRRWTVHRAQEVEILP